MTPAKNPLRTIPLRVGYTMHGQPSRTFTSFLRRVAKRCVGRFPPLTPRSLAPRPQRSKTSRFAFPFFFLTLPRDACIFGSSFSVLSGCICHRPQSGRAEQSALRPSVFPHPFPATAAACKYSPLFLLSPPAPPREKRPAVFPPFPFGLPFPASLGYFFLLYTVCFGLF